MIGWWFWIPQIPENERKCLLGGYLLRSESQTTAGTQTTGTLNHSSWHQENTKPDQSRLKTGAGYPSGEGKFPDKGGKADFPLDWPKEVTSTVAMPANLSFFLRPVPHWRGGSKEHTISPSAQNVANLRAKLARKSVMNQLWSKKKLRRVQGQEGVSIMWLGGISPVIAFLDEQELSKWKQTHVFLNFSLQLLLSSTVMEQSLEYGFLFYIQEVQPSILMKNGGSVPRSSWVFTYCWWFRNLKTTTWHVWSPCKQWDLNYQPQLVSRPDLFQPSTAFPSENGDFCRVFIYFPTKTSIEVDPSFPKTVDQQKPRFFHIGKGFPGVPPQQLAIGFPGGGPTWQFAPDFRRAPSYPTSGVSFSNFLHHFYQKKLEKNVEFFDDLLKKKVWTPKPSRPFFLGEDFF